MVQYFPWISDSLKQFPTRFSTCRIFSSASLCHFLLLSSFLRLMKTSILLEKTTSKNHLSGCCDEPRTVLFLTCVSAKLTSHAFLPSLTTSISDSGRWFSNAKWWNLPIKRGFWEKWSVGSSIFFSDTPSHEWVKPIVIHKPCGLDFRVFLSLLWTRNSVNIGLWYANRLVLPKGTSLSFG